MPAGASARRYAQAAFEIAVERDDAEGWLADLELLADSTANEDFMRTLSAPRIPFARKQALIQEAFGFLPVQRRRMDAFWTDERRKESANPGFWTDELREEYRKISRGDYSVGVLGINLMLLLASRNLVHLLPAIADRFQQLLKSVRDGGQQVDAVVGVHLLPAIADRFQELLDAHNGVSRAEAVSAVPLDDGQRRSVERALADVYGGEIRLTSRVDPEILGGMVIRIGDKVLDGSARTRLQNMRRELAQRR